MYQFSISPLCWCVSFLDIPLKATHTMKGGDFVSSKFRSAWSSGVLLSCQVARGPPSLVAGETLSSTPQQYDGLVSGLGVTIL